jgi:uncharacterized protein (DUF697 family)
MSNYEENQDLTFRANIIIHGFAVAAAGCSALTATVPFLGPLMGDTIGLTAITVAMTMSLANLFGKTFEKGALMSLSSVLIGMFLGVNLLKGVTSFIPGAGSLANAGITLALHEAIGWGLFLILERGGDPTKMSKKELKEAIDKGKERAKREKENYEKALNNIPEEERDEIKRLQKKMADKKISPEEKQSISDIIVFIFEKYNSNTGE